MSAGDAWGGTWAGVWAGAWGEDAPAVVATAGGFASGRRNKAWPKRKKRPLELNVQIALHTRALTPRFRS